MQACCCRRHISLLRSLVPDGTSSIIPVHTILEVYRVSDMSLVRVLPSAEDEVNAATFHPHPVSFRRKLCYPQFCVIEQSSSSAACIEDYKASLCVSGHILFSLKVALFGHITCSFLCQDSGLATNSYCC